ncbi:MAG: ATP-binding protein [Pirellulales bacterium]
MAEHTVGSNRQTELRKRAETTLNHRSQVPPDTSVEGINRLVHELLTHQSELEMQNEELRQAQLELVESRDKYLDLYDTAPVGFATVNQQGLILKANLTLAHMLNVDRPFLTTSPLSKFIVVDDEDLFYLHIQSLKTTKARQTCQLQMRSGKTDSFWAEMQSIFVEQPNGDMICFQITINDISVRKQAEEVLQQDREELENQVKAHTAKLSKVNRQLSWQIRERQQVEETVRRAERLSSLGALAAGIAHEINNPLGAALLSAETAMEVKDDPDETERFKKCLSNVIASLDRCVRIVRNLLTFSRDKPAVKKLYPISEVIQQSQDLVQSYARQHQTTIRLALDSDLPKLVIDRLEIELALINLLRNAVQAGGEENRVVIRAQLANSAVRITVEDKGCGMTCEQKKNAFAPFFTTRQTQGGTGLGLSITYDIVQNHGGTIEVQSTLGEGTTVIVTLPISEAVGKTTEQS